MGKNPERQLAGSIGFAAAYALHGGTAMTAPGRAAGPGQLRYWLERQPPEWATELTEADRVKRAEAAKRAHFLRLAHKSLMVRRKKAKARKKAS